MGENKIIKLPESELEIMQAIWALYEEGEPYISAGLVMKRYPELNRLKLTTVLTLITRLQLKGYIKFEKINRSKCYTPLISADEYKKFASEDFVCRVYMNDRLGLILNLVSDENLTLEELNEIKKIIDKKSKI